MATLRPDFDPRLGFVAETDLEGPSVNASIVTDYQGKRIETIAGWFGANSYHHLTTGDLFHKEISVSGYMRYANGTWCNVGTQWGRRPPNSDHTTFVWAGWNSKALHRGGSVGTNWGRLGGADYLFVSVSQACELRPQLYCNLGYEYRRSDYSDPTPDESIARYTLSMNYDITPERGVAGRLLTGTLGTNWYLTYRQAVRRGTDFFVIVGDPNALHTRERIAAKVKWIL